MAKGLRQNFEQLLAELPAFRKDLDKIVKAAAEQQPALKDSLAQLLQGFDESIGEVKQTMPQTLTDLEKSVDGLKQETAELQQSIADAERQGAAVPPTPAPPTAPESLPAGHGQTLRAELLERFAAPSATGRGVLAAGDVHDLTSGDWKDIAPTRKPATNVPGKPAAGKETPRKETPGHDVDDMKSQDWR